MKRVFRLSIPICATLLGLWLFFFGVQSQSRAAASVFASGREGSPARSSGSLNGSITVCRAGPPLCDFSVIQDAVDVALAGDTILVAGGVYTDINNDAGLAQILYLDKSVIIRGGYTTEFADPPDPGSNPTVLDAQGRGRVAYIDASDPLLEGLTFTGGDATGLDGTPYGDDAGGGFYIWGGTPVISNSIITDNYAPQDGGGIYMRMFSGAELIRNDFSNNRAKYGGGIYVWYSYPSVFENSITSNSASGNGGGVWLGVYSQAVFGNNVFQKNISGLTTNEGAGGMLAERCTLTMDGNVFQNNSAEEGAGGLNLVRCQATLTNNIFTDNYISGSGGGLQLLGTDATLIHNTFARNRGGTPSGLRLSTHWEPASSDADIVNTIFAGETVGVYAETGNVATLDATLWGSGAWSNGGDWVGPGSISTGSVNLWGDPAFLAPDHLDYHITNGSMAADRGLDAGVYADIDGDLRPSGGGFDIGADELVSGLFLVPASQAGSGAPGSEVSYSIALSNLTGITDSYQLRLGEHAWTTNLSSNALGPLADGDMRIFTVTATIPPESDWYDAENVVITAASVTSPTDYYATALINTQAYAPPQISLSPTSLSSVQRSNQVVAKELSIQNGYGVSLTFELASGLLTSDPVLLMHLDEPAGATTFSDNSGYDNDGTCEGTLCPASGVPGKFSSAVSFDGLDDLIVVEDDPSLNPQDAIAISAWFYAHDWNGNRRILQKGMGDRQYRLMAEYGDFHLDIADIGRVTTALPTAGEWHHAVGTYDGSRMQLWVDGVLEAEQSYTGLIPTTSDPVYIGTKCPGCPLGDYFYGEIDELVVFNRALSAEEIESLYSIGLIELQAPWLTLDPLSGFVPTNSSVPIQATFDATDLQAGMYTTTLRVASDDPRNPLVQVPVTMTVDPSPPDLVTITGPQSWFTGIPASFTAEISPSSTTPPLEYTWKATQQALIIHNSGLRDSVTYSWDKPGRKAIRVTASNNAGRVRGRIVVRVQIPKARVYFPVVFRTGIPDQAANSIPR